MWRKFENIWNDGVADNNFDGVSTGKIWLSLPSENAGFGRKKEFKEIFQEDILEPSSPWIGPKFSNQQIW